MNYRLLASDLDGTLLDRSGRISKENWDAIAEMTKRGVYFVPASGRCFSELPAEIRDSDLIRYYILSGGAAAYDKTEDRFMVTCPPKSVKNQVLDLLCHYPTCLFVHSGKVSFVDADLHDAETYSSYNLNPYWVEYALEKEKPIENFKDVIYDLDGIPMLVVFFRNLDDLNECKQILSGLDDILVVQSDPYNLEIVSAKAGKGNALLSLATCLGLSREQTIAVGDSHNDRTMLEVAGLSLAMKNALPEMQAIADEIICDNDSHCASYILDHYLS